MIRDNRGVIKANKYEASSSLPIATNNTNASLRDSKFDNNYFFEDCRDNKSITESMESMNLCYNEAQVGDDEQVMITKYGSKIKSKSKRKSILIKFDQLSDRLTKKNPHKYHSLSTDKIEIGKYEPLLNFSSSWPENIGQNDGDDSFFNNIDIRDDIHPAEIEFFLDERQIEFEHDERSESSDTLETNEENDERKSCISMQLSSTSNYEFEQN